MSGTPHSDEYATVSARTATCRGYRNLYRIRSLTEVKSSSRLIAGCPKQMNEKTRISASAMKNADAVAVNA